MCNDVLFFDSRCHLHTNPVLGECTLGGEMYKTNIFVKVRVLSSCFTVPAV